jgi:thiamine biosynthesis lipoprotein
MADPPRGPAAPTPPRHGQPSGEQVDACPRSASLPSRRDILALGAGAFVVAMLPLVRRRDQLVRRTVPVMGTLGELAVLHHDRRYAHGALDAATAELARVERMLTWFSETSDVGRVNRDAARDAVVVSGETARVIEVGLDWAVTSDGAFDPSVGRIVALWDVTHRREPPPEREVKRLAGRGFYRSVDLSPARGGVAVRLSDPDARIDLGGIAVGYGVDRAVQVLRDWGIRRGLVNVGGDIYALGASEDGDPWRIGVRSANDPARLVGEVTLEDAAVTTSGDYFQYFEYAGRRYHHLMDPRSAAPVEARRHSVTVRADDCMTADAGATAAFVLGDRADVVLRRRPANVEIVTVA